MIAFDTLYDGLYNVCILIGCWQKRNGEEIMLRQVVYNGVTIEYDLQYKNVRNINLRIVPGGGVKISANPMVPCGAVDDFVISRGRLILGAIERFAKLMATEPNQYYAEDEIRDVISATCQRVYPYYQNRGIGYPVIKFRNMVSRWGSCNAQKGVLTFNTKLMYAPPECVEYVVLHEFTHFLQANHSKRFYSELGKVCPDWKKYRDILKTIYIGGDNISKNEK